MMLPVVRATWRGVRAGLGAAVLVVAFARCIAADMSGPTASGANVPVVGMSDGQFGFAVTARDWTYDQSYSPNLSGGTLQIGLVVEGYTTGTGTLAVTDATDASVFAQNLAGNVAEGNRVTVHGTPPFRVHVATSHYTGTISVGIAPATAPPGAARR